ncbi:uncharacterized protein BO97DRAFT_428931 [Aspergillus homomorphus CBS 101889]|uniref:Uncharacterized protein n=1 Tax=Aspergillus homomorphus (strain CBS 101889) TaxID=1450537 RepID=A0A395HJE3_ASPHC|nr:hypothetical protein BO97DRAFT_428931 [Aspergillus homomorphus CBS 101889]RAL07890.1 hypothetical protein BO97DRAFT_428931 [Aspergillus homomorphus CBS 101889]
MWIYHANNYPHPQLHSGILLNAPISKTPSGVSHDEDEQKPPPDGAIGIVSVVIALMLLNALGISDQAAPPLEHLTLLGYHNDGLTRANVACDDPLLNSTLAVQPSFYLHDNHH